MQTRKGKLAHMQWCSSTSFNMVQSYIPCMHAV